MCIQSQDILCYFSFADACKDKYKTEPLRKDNGDVILYSTIHFILPFDVALPVKKCMKQRPDV